MKTVIIDILFELQHLEQVSELSEALFLPIYRLAIVSIYCVFDGSCVLCGEVFKAIWSEELNDKCAAVIYF